MSKIRWLGVIWHAWVRMFAGVSVASRTQMQPPPPGLTILGFICCCIFRFRHSVWVCDPHSVILIPLSLSCFLASSHIPEHPSALSPSSGLIGAN